MQKYILYIEDAKVYKSKKIQYITTYRYNNIVC